MHIEKALVNGARYWGRMLSGRARELGNLWVYVERG